MAVITCITCHGFSLVRKATIQLSLLALLLILPGFLTAAELQPFTSDGCSVFPDGTFQQNQLWLTCCRAHDFAYWKGGTYKERLAADKALRQCVEDVGEESIALLMLAGVRVGGTPFLPTTFRWGYGWPYPRFYGSLTDDEQRQVEEMIAGDKAQVPPAHELLPRLTPRQKGVTEK